MSFFPTNFELPKSTNKFLRKFEEGTTKIKFLQTPVLGWVSKVYNEADKKAKPTVDYWKYEQTPKQPNPQANLFLGCIVYNFEANSIQYLELTTKSLINSLIELENNGYELLETDIVVKREGTTKENTKYSLVPTPKATPISTEIEQSLKDLAPDLNRVFVSDGNPFSDDIVEETETTPTATRAIANQELPEINVDEINVDEINVQMPF